MRHYKLLKLLKSLSNEEYLRLGKFLRSPFFNYSTPLVSFYEALKRYYPDFEEKKVQPERIWTKVFPDKKYNQTKFWRLCSDLGLLVEKYLIQLELEEPKPYAQHLLIKSLGRRNAFDLYEKQVKSSLSALDKVKIKDANWYRERIQLLEDWYFHPLKDKFAKEDKSLSDLMDSLDTHFLLQKAKFSIGLVSLEKILQRKHEIRYLALLEETSNEILLLYLYKISLALSQSEEESIFLKLEEILFENFDKLNEEDKRLFFSNGLNYSIRKMNQGNAKFQGIALEWYKRGLQNTLIQTNDYISEIAFQNITYIGCLVGEGQWVENFMEKYGNFLQQELQEDCLSYCKAILYFHQEEFDETIRILTRENWVKNYLISSRNLLIRATFENFLLDRSSFEQIQSTLQSFEIFILRTKLFPKKRLEAHLNLVRLLKKLSKKITARKTKADIQQWLNKELNSNKKIISRSWLSSLIDTTIKN